MNSRESTIITMLKLRAREGSLFSSSILPTDLFIKICSDSLNIDLGNECKKLNKLSELVTARNDAFFDPVFLNTKTNVSQVLNLHFMRKDFSGFIKNLVSRIEKIKIMILSSRDEYMSFQQTVKLANEIESEKENVLKNLPLEIQNELAEFEKNLDHPKSTSCIIF